MIIYLYKKTHRITGLKYLGKTTAKNPYSYAGSGTYCKRHLDVHGYEYDTEILKESHSNEEIKKWGIYYSQLWNIVDERDEHGNKTWANLKPEMGDGGDPGPEGRRKIAEAHTGKKHTPEQNANKSKRQAGVKKSSDWIKNRTGEKHPMYGKARPDVAARIGQNHPNFGKSWKKTAEQIEKITGDNNPMKQPKWQITCEHCSKIMNKGLYGRWHGNNCKYKK